MLARRKYTHGNYSGIVPNLVALSSFESDIRDTGEISLLGGSFALAFVLTRHASVACIGLNIHADCTTRYSETPFNHLMLYLGLKALGFPSPYSQRTRETLKGGMTSLSGEFVLDETIRQGECGCVSKKAHVGNGVDLINQTVNVVGFFWWLILLEVCDGHGT